MRTADGLHRQMKMALEAALHVIRDPNDPIGEYDRIAMLYNSETGFKPPGKDMPFEQEHDDPIKHFDDWFDNKKINAIALAEDALRIYREVNMP